MNIQRDLQPFIRSDDEYGDVLDRTLLDEQASRDLRKLVSGWADLFSRNTWQGELSQAGVHRWLEQQLEGGLYTFENFEVVVPASMFDWLAGLFYTELMKRLPKVDPLTPLQRELLRDLATQPIRARVTFYFDRQAIDALYTLQTLGYAKFDGKTYTVTAEGRKALDPYRRFQPGQQVRLKTDQAYKAGTVGFVQRYGDPDNRHDLMYLDMGSDLLLNVGDTFVPGLQAGVWVGEDEIELIPIPVSDTTDWCAGLPGDDILMEGQAYRDSGYYCQYKHYWSEYTNPGPAILSARIIEPSIPKTEG